MAQHFLLSPASKTLTLARVFRMSDAEPKRRRRREAKAQRRTPSGGNFDFREELAPSAKGKTAAATGFYRGRRS